jgi:kinesin family protein C1
VLFRSALVANRAERAERERDSLELAAGRETSALREELREAKAHRADVEPRLESLGAELAEARAEAKVAKAESEYLRRAGEEARDRAASADAERVSALEQLETVRETARGLENAVSVTQSASDGLRLKLEASEKNVSRLEMEIAAAIEKRRVAESEAANAVSLRSRLETLRATHASQSEALADARRELFDSAAVTAGASSRADEKENRAKSLQEKVSELERVVARKDAEARQSAIVRRALHNQVQELKGNIRVFCRVRPLCVRNGEDPRSASTGCGKDLSHPLLKVSTTGEDAGRAVSLWPPGKEKPFDFAFDRVFGSDATQAEVFEDISHLVTSALDGYKVCVFAYGQTGSGKTYTVLGGGDDHDDHDTRGLIPRCIEQIFQARDASGDSDVTSASTSTPRLTVTATMVEIYNEEIKDLLASGTGVAGESKHEVKHDSCGETTVTHLHSVEVASVDEVTELMTRAAAARTTAATKMNDRSSRSHAVFTLKLRSVDSSGRVANGTLHLVDLAGSERLKQTGATGDRLKEAQNINKSLSALGDVVSALAEKHRHVPYRNSKLTYLLQNALGGDGKTLMFANVSPSAESSQETLCSLRFAQKVNSCAVGRSRAANK